MKVSEFLIRRLRDMYQAGDKRGIGTLLALAFEEDYRSHSDEEMMDILIDVERRVLANIGQSLQHSSK